MKFLDKIKNQDALIIFLIVECLAICSFALGGISYIFYGLGIFVGVVTILFSYNRFKGEDLKTLLVFMLPMFVLSIFLSFGRLLSGHILENILVFLSINVFLFLGIAARKFKGFKADLVLIAVGVSIALLVLICMFITWAQYGLFYASRFKDTPIYYYNAETFDITKETVWLIGFKIKETSIIYTSAFAVLLACYLFGLLFISPKKETRKFAIYAVIGTVGLVYLITIPYLVAFQFLLPALAVTLVYRFVKLSKKANDIINYALLFISALAIIFFIFAFMNAAGSVNEDNPSKIVAIISSNHFLDRIFNSNRIMDPINIVLRQGSLKYNLFGFVSTFNENVLSYSEFEAVEEAVVTNSKMFEIEFIKEGGIFTIFLIVLIIIMGYINARKYVKESSDEKHEKIIIVSMLLSFTFYKSFESDVFPLIHEPDNYYSFVRNPLTLVMIFFLGMLFVSKPNPTIQTKEEKQNDVEEVSI